MREDCVIPPVDLNVRRFSTTHHHHHGERVNETGKIELFNSFGTHLLTGWQVHAKYLGVQGFFVFYMFIGPSQKQIYKCFLTLYNLIKNFRFILKNIFFKYIFLNVHVYFSNAKNIQKKKNYFKFIANVFLNYHCYVCKSIFNKFVKTIQILSK